VYRSNFCFDGDVQAMIGGRGREQQGKGEGRETEDRERRREDERGDWKGSEE